MQRRLSRSSTETLPEEVRINSSTESAPSTRTQSSQSTTLQQRSPSPFSHLDYEVNFKDLEAKHTVKNLLTQHPTYLTYLTFQRLELKLNVKYLQTH